MQHRAFVLSVLALTNTRACDVRQYGAVGARGHDDTVAIQSALDDPECEEIEFASGLEFSASVLWVRRSHVVLTIANNATLAGMPDVFKAERPDCNGSIASEFNWRNWCAMLRVESPSNFTLRGGGVLAPGGVGGSDPDYYSAVHVKATAGVTLSNVRFHCTAWWWCSALHNASHVSVTNVFVDGSAGRDGMDLVNCRDVVITDSRIEGSDDGLCFKTITADGLTGWPASRTVVRRSSLASTWCNALQFGSATEVDMHDFEFEDLQITRGPKSGIGIVSMDSANISRVSFTNISIHGADVATPIYIKIGNRVHGETNLSSNRFPPGSIANVSFTDIRAYDWGTNPNPKPGHASNYTLTIEGLNASYPVGPIKLERLAVEAPGGGTAEQALIDPPLAPTDYQPRKEGVRPSWGLFVRYATGIEFVDSALSAVQSDERPALVMDNTLGSNFSGTSVDDAGRGGCQLALRNASGQWPDVGVCEWAPNAAE